MLRATFLGHQGWLFETSRRRVLVDPLLTDSFGHGGAIGRVFPPRALEVRAMPAVDAVLLTHEHEDHFDVPSLHRLDRAIPVYLSARSSVAARRFLHGAGFRGGLLRPGEELDLDGVCVATFTGDHVTYNQGDEWDALPYLLRDPTDGASFFSAVDVLPTDAMMAEVRARAERPGLVCHTHNASSLAWASLGGAPAAPVDTFAVAADTIRQHAQLRRDWGRPAATLFCGGGFAFTGDREPLNRRTFSADSARVAEALRALSPDERFIAPTPGLTVCCEGDRVTAVEPEAPWLRARPVSEWPDRAFDATPYTLARYEPVAGDRGLSPESFGQLAAELSDFAAYLYGLGTFRALYSLTAAQLGGRTATFALVCRVAEGDTDGAVVFVYDAAARDFRPVRCERPVETYLAGVECWASDLLGLFRAEHSAAALLFGRYRSWNAAPERFAFSLVGELMRYVHPLRQPDRHTALYRRLLSRESPNAPRVGARGAPARTSLLDG